MAKKKKYKRELSAYFELTIMGLSCEVTATVTPGDPGSGPTYDCGGTPPSGPEVEFGVAWVLRNRKPHMKLDECWYDDLSDDTRTRLENDVLEQIDERASERYEGD